jgi:hypothetical protein
MDIYNKSDLVKSGIGGNSVIPVLISERLFVQAGV